jgi:hypothetical protein
MGCLSLTWILTCGAAVVRIGGAGAGARGALCVTPLPASSFPAAVPSLHSSVCERCRSRATLARLLHRLHHEGNAAHPASRSALFALRDASAMARALSDARAGTDTNQRARA